MNWKQTGKQEFRCGKWTIQLWDDASHGKPGNNWHANLFLHRRYMGDYTSPRRREVIRRAKNRAQDISVDVLRAMEHTDPGTGI